MSAPDQIRSDGPWGSRVAAVTGFLDLMREGTGHCIAVSAGDGSIFVQAMLTGDGTVYMEMSERWASILGPEQLRSGGWTVPTGEHNRVGDEAFAHPTRRFEAGCGADAARALCAEVDRMAADGGWEIHVFPCSGSPGWPHDETGPTD